MLMDSLRFNSFLFFPTITISSPSSPSLLHHHHHLLPTSSLLHPPHHLFSTIITSSPPSSLLHPQHLSSTIIIISSPPSSPLPTVISSPSSSSSLLHSAGAFLSPGLVQTLIWSPWGIRFSFLCVWWLFDQWLFNWWLVPPLDHKLSEDRDFG